MKSNTKKWLTVIGCLAVCVILIAVIAGSFRKAPVTDDPPQPSSSSQEEIVVDPSGSTPPTDPASSSSSDITVEPQLPSPEPADTGNGAVSSGTDQTIQADPVKPETPDEETLTNPSQKPDGTPVEDTPKPEDHDTYEPPVPPSNNTSGGLPGFDNVPNAGENQGEYLDDMYENGNKIGIMG